MVKCKCGHDFNTHSNRMKTYSCMVCDCVQYLPDKAPLSVAIGGKFDPIHDGHIDYIWKAGKLGDYLYIIVNPDVSVVKFSAKRFCAVPLKYRTIILKGLLHELGLKGEVVVAVDEDGTVAKTLRMLKPDIFAKGGDRVPDNMPKIEIDTCEELGIPIIYGIGDLLNSSTKICKGWDEHREES